MLRGRYREFYYSGVEGAEFRDGQVGAGDGEVESSRAARARVYIEDAFVAADFRFVAVTVKDGTEACGGWVEVELLDVVEQVEVMVGERDDFGCRQEGTGATCIDVAADGGDWGDFGEGAEDFRVADVAEVEDVIGAGEEREQFGAKKAVGVADDGDAHGEILSRG